MQEIGRGCCCGPVAVKVECHMLRHSLMPALIDCPSGEGPSWGSACPTPSSFDHEGDWAPSERPTTFPGPSAKRGDSLAAQDLWETASVFHLHWVKMALSITVHPAYLLGQVSVNFTRSLCSWRWVDSVRGQVPYLQELSHHWGGGVLTIDQKKPEQCVLPWLRLGSLVGGGGGGCWISVSWGRGPRWANTWPPRQGTCSMFGQKKWCETGAKWKSEGFGSPPDTSEFVSTSCSQNIILDFRVTLLLQPKSHQHLQRLAVRAKSTGPLLVSLLFASRSPLTSSPGAGRV